MIMVVICSCTIVVVIIIKISNWHHNHVIPFFFGFLLQHFNLMVISMWLGVRVLQRRHGDSCVNREWWINWKCDSINYSYLCFHPWKSPCDCPQTLQLSRWNCTHYAMMVCRPCPFQQLPTGHASQWPFVSQLDDNWRCALSRGSVDRHPCHSRQIFHSVEGCCSADANADVAACPPPSRSLCFHNGVFVLQDLSINNSTLRYIREIRYLLIFCTHLAARCRSSQQLMPWRWWKQHLRLMYRNRSNRRTKTPKKTPKRVVTSTVPAIQ